MDMSRGDLILTLKKQWFDMVLSGEKTEEYREMKPYWEKRFGNYFGKAVDFSNASGDRVWDTHKKTIVFRNGYRSDSPTFSAECTISEGYGKEEWGAQKGEKYFILTIHRIFRVENTHTVC